MPAAAPRWCSFCRTTHPHWAACPQRTAERRAEIDRARPGPRQRGYDSQWQHARAAFLAENPRCAFCGAPATEVHHAVDHKGDMAVFWNRAHWIASCRPCHSGISLGRATRGVPA